MVMILEVNSETDFVARDDNFLNFANSVLELAFTSRETDVAKLMSSGLEDAREKLVQKIGENINVRRVEIIEFKNVNDGIVDTYIHSNNRIAELVAITGGDDSLAKELTLQVAAVNPIRVRAADCTQVSVGKGE